MDILLTGAGGFTGQHLSRCAQAAGHRVVPLGANLCDAAALRAEVGSASFDSVLHLAGLAFVGHADPAALYAVNTVGTLNLLDALAAAPRRPRRVVLASSANVYGNCAQSPIAETQPCAPTNHYAASKMAMEALARTHPGGLPIVIARPFNYTGVGQSLDFLIPKLVHHYARRSPSIALGNLDVEREFNDVGYIAQAYLALLSGGEPGQTYNLCTGQPHSLRSVLAMLENLTGHSPRIVQDPALMRPNEVHRLCGDPQRLAAVLQAHSGAQPQPPTLRHTLQTMLAAAV
ncbi:MAG: GDP-mannose 4,6-dehydratase [Rhodoferax sp.]